MPNNLRADRIGANRTAYDKNRKRVLASQDICGICGKPVNKLLKRPDPMAAEVDHIVPVSRGGHPSDISNLQLVHAACNKLKSDRLGMKKEPAPDVLQWSFDWVRYRAKKDLTNMGGG